MTDHHLSTAWGHMEEEQEEDIKVAQIEAMGSSPNTRVRFNKNRTVVRYPSEKSLLLEETPTIINDEDEFEDGEEKEPKIEDGQCEVDGEEEHEEEVIEKDVVAIVAAQTTNANAELSTNSSSNGDMKNADSIDRNNSATNSATSNSSRSWFQRAQVVKRYTPRFTPPPQEEANNGEDESDQEDDDQEEEEDDDDDQEEEDDKSGSQDDEEGYDSVVEESGSEEEDPIKKIAEESLVSTKKKLQEIQGQKKAQQTPPDKIQETSGLDSIPHALSEREKILQDVALLKDQLRNEVDKVEQASKAASAAASKAEEDNISLTSRVASMRSLLAVLCGGC